MVVLNRIYTRTGDTGETALGSGDRVSKAHLRIHAYGTVDETNAVVGIVRLHTTGMAKLDSMLARIQNELFDLGADLCVPDTGKDLGYEPLRIDRKEHINKIDDEIIAEIRRSRFLVADFTQGESGARGGVYYEAGFAHGLNIPVIFTCQENAIGKVHFDTRQYNHITWKTPEELQARLAQRISATIGDGPLKKPG